MDRLAEMETFVRVIDAGSFSAAARLLEVGQPAVSKSVAHLERRLGVRLLTRSTRGLTLTEAGKLFYERAKHVLDDVEAADLAARGASAGLSGHLRVSAAVTFARLHVVPRLPAFLAAHPDLSIDILLDDRSIDIVEEGIDVALRMGRVTSPSATARKLASSRRMVLASPVYLQRAGVPATPSALTGHEAIIYAQGSGGETWSFRRGSTEVSVAVTGRLRVSAAEGVRAAVLAGIGVAVGSEWMFATELATGELVPVLPEWTMSPTELWAVFPSGRLASAKARAFAAFVRTALRDDADRD